MKPRVTLRRALDDPNLLGGALPGDSWKPWRVLLIAAMGEALDDEERATFIALTGREREPLHRVHELAAVVGRRGGKTRALSALASYIAALNDHTAALARGETGVVLCLAQDQRVAAKVLAFVEADLTGSDVLRPLIKGRSVDAIELTNGISIEVRAASFRRLRGPTYVAVLCDELAFWYADEKYANPDIEVLAAVRPGLLTTNGPLIMASSPYGKRGVLWDVYRAQYGLGGDPLLLVAKGTTRELNPTVSQGEIDRALAADRVRNTAEYLAEFRADIEGFVALETVEACVGGHHSLPPAAGVTYRAFVDPSGGSEDAMTMAIGHRSADGLIMIDALHEARPPFSPAAVVADFAKALQAYGITGVSGDRYGGEWCREPFRRHSIGYDPHTASKSDLYRDLLPLLNNGGIALPRHERLVDQIVALERRTGRGTGREIIDHPPRAHDDLANAVAGLASLCATRVYRYDPAGWGRGFSALASGGYLPFGDGAAADAEWRRQQYWSSVLPLGYHE